MFFFILTLQGYYWHITDFHYDHSYWTEQLSCNDEVPAPGKYGDYWCDSPWLLVVDSIASLASIKDDVDFIIWTGYVLSVLIRIYVYVYVQRHFSNTVYCNVPRTYHGFMSGYMHYGNNTYVNV